MSKTTQPSRRNTVRSQTVHHAYFALRATLARAISVIGAFNDWDPTALPLKRDKDGCWKAAVDLPTGGHEYLFVVDGALMLDPEADSVPSGSFGRHSILVVPRPPLSRLKRFEDSSEKKVKIHTPAKVARNE